MNRIQKVFTTIFLLLKDPQPSVIDRVHQAEKLGMIDAAETLLEIRDVRNQISHEYAEDALLQIFHDVARLAPKLKTAARQTAAYARARFPGP